MRKGKELRARCDSTSTAKAALAGIGALLAATGRLGSSAISLPLLLRVPVILIELAGIAKIISAANGPIVG